MEEKPNIAHSFADALKKNISFELTDNENDNSVWRNIQNESEEDALKIAMRRSMDDKVYSRKTNPDSKCIYIYKSVFYKKNVIKRTSRRAFKKSLIFILTITV
jgi:hypothetical protein